MAEKKFQPAPKFTTPVGVARFPHLNKPDEYQGQVKFKTGLILSAADAAAIVKVVAAEMPKAEALRDAFLEASRKGGKKAKPQEEVLPYRDMVDPDTGDETGNVLVSFASNAEVDEYQNGKKTGRKKTRTIPFFSAKGQPVGEKEKPALWGGSRLRISYSCFPYHNAGANNYGVSLRIEAVKVIEAVTGGTGGNADAYGFGDEEEGWSKPAASSMEGDESEGGTDTETAGPDDGDF